MELRCGVPQPPHPLLRRVRNVSRGWLAWLVRQASTGPKRNQTLTERQDGRAGELDEFGLPLAWVRARPLQIADVDSDWAIFERWANARGIRAFPASITSALLFLVDAPVSGPALHRAWEAIDVKHDQRYWHTDANPVMQLQIGWGLRVKEDGSVQLQPRSQDGSP
jgi:hypothetical protein